MLRKQTIYNLNFLAVEFKLIERTLGREQNCSANVSERSLAISLHEKNVKLPLKAVLSHENTFHSNRLDTVGEEFIILSNQRLVFFNISSLFWLNSQESVEHTDFFPPLKF